MYQNQYTQEFIEQVAMDLVDFFKIFDDWHCGLNQLKKFNQVPFEWIINGQKDIDIFDTN
jgi:hypothetical protein